jgi:FkbM family methyltransferase
MTAKLLFIILLIFKNLCLVLAKLASKSKSKKNSSYLIRSLLSILSQVINKIGLTHQLSISPDGRSYSIMDGVILNNQGTNRYFKWRNKNSNEAYWMAQQMIEHDITPKTIMDIGANFGEISLYFSKKYPKSKIFSIEPSPANILIMEDNLSIQNFNTNNINLIKKAVSDKLGYVEINTGLGSEDSIIISRTADGSKQSKKSTKVEAITLTNICEEFEITEIDFLKIDIEGAEPLLISCLHTLLPKIKSMLIEVGDKNSFELYEKLLKTIFSYNMVCYKAGESIKNTKTLDEAIESIRPNPKRKKNININYFFIKEDLINK